MSARLIDCWAMTVLTFIFLVRPDDFINSLRGAHALAWIGACCLAMLFGQPTFSYISDRIARRRRKIRSVIIIGVNEITMRVANTFSRGPHAGMHMHGYFDDRDAERRPWQLDHPVLGTLDDIPAYVREKNIHMVFISVPVAGHARIAKLSSELQDTTASIYFVPDMSVFALTPPRLKRVGDVPVLAVCETPFVGINSAVKRCSDVVLAALILGMLAPLMLAIAVGVAATSPGPIIFRQRRYGLYGETIVVYKFRTMTVTDDGPVILQARQNDRRLTSIGAFLRRSSLDELPQFINVLQGRMSIVGPRPHAVAHNEHYRKLIKGYMLRHKIKPGITGWAQVNGLRGETLTIDKMEARVRYDFDYIRRWSLWFDLVIIAKTIGVVLQRQNAH
jgi:putative colanic acid biosynthesis UDP-glucose lipid carrier transferase